MRGDVPPALLYGPTSAIASDFWRCALLRSDRRASFGKEPALDRDIFACASSTLPRTLSFNSVRRG